MKIRIINKDKRIAFYFVKKKATNKKNAPTATVDAK